jgi:phage terminase large subunit-like protein
MSKNDDRDHEIGRKAAEIEAAARRAQRYFKLNYWRPYPRQEEFIALTRRYRESGFFAATQVGKTETAAFVMAANLTGLYPKWWLGCRFDDAISAWAVSESLKMSRDVVQKKLCGEPGSKEDFGSGMIPRHLFVGDPVMARGEGDAYDSVQVRHVSGGISTLRFRTYQAGRQALQGATLDFLWLDEEPDDLEIYSECLARISARPHGRLIITFTPLKGMSGISIRFRQEQSPDRAFVQMGLADVPAAKDDFDEGGGSGDAAGGPYGHIPLGERERIISSYAAHEREARSKGEPMLGEGRVYAAPEDGAIGGIVEDEDHLAWPKYWTWGWGIDPGAGHPFGATLCCYDNDAKIFHVVAEIRMSDATITQHCTSMRQIEKNLLNSEGMEIPVAWPPDTGTRDRTSMVPLTKLYGQYFRMMSEPASLPGITGQSKFSLEGSVAEIDQWERNGKWKVHRRCRAYLEERRLYHRKNGEIVKLHDDVLCAARYAFMNRRYFKPLDVCYGIPNAVIGPGGRRQSDPHARFARGTPNHPGGSFDVFTGRAFE